MLKFLEKNKKNTCTIRDALSGAGIQTQQAAYLVYAGLQSPCLLNLRAAAAAGGGKLLRIL